ncbi:hypothetical protein D3C85_1214640 [compost metagenome]
MKGVAHRRQQRHALRRQRQPARLAHEQLQPVVRFQRLDVAADRALGQVQGVAGAGERQLFGCHQEHAQRVEGREFHLRVAMSFMHGKHAY